MAKTHHGRLGLFGPKNVRGGKCRKVQAHLGPVAAKLFDGHRLALGQIAKVAPVTLSDGDVVEYLVRGRMNTKLKLKGDVK